MSAPDVVMDVLAAVAVLAGVGAILGFVLAGAQRAWEYFSRTR